LVIIQINPEENINMKLMHHYYSNNGQAVGEESECYVIFSKNHMKNMFLLLGLKTNFIKNVSKQVVVLPISSNI